MNQSPKLIFRKTNFVATKHMKTFSFPEMLLHESNTAHDNFEKTKREKGVTFAMPTLPFFNLECTVNAVNLMQRMTE